MMVIRYSASGTSQSSGTAATSAEIYAVIATGRPDGTNASAIQRNMSCADRRLPCASVTRAISCCVRKRVGHLLCPGGLLAADKYNQPENAFGFKKADPDDIGCPPGSHVRRANPRDSLAKNLASAQTLLDAANNHRILRRGRKYGATLSDRYRDDGAERGLLFICLNTDIARQFEFVQQTWLLNRNFATLFDETDPLSGRKATSPSMSSRCGGSSRSRPSSSWRVANTSSCRACRH
jgi:hypothetical protein